MNKQFASACYTACAVHIGMLRELCDKPGDRVIKVNRGSRVTLRNVVENSSEIGLGFSAPTDREHR